MADAPLIFWQLDETSGTAMLDSSNAYHGTYAGTIGFSKPALVPSSSGSAVQFNGLNARAYIASDPLFNATASGFTIEFWAKLDDPSSDAAQVLVDKTGTSMTNGQWSIYWDNRISQGSPQRFRVICGNNGGGSANPIVDWNGAAAMNALANGGHFVYKFDPSGPVKHSIFYNGVSVSTSNVGVTITSNSRQIDIGCVNGSTSPVLFLKGTMDDIAFYNYPLAVANIAAHYASGILIRKGWGIVR